jgi:hypothetical protein
MVTMKIASFLLLIACQLSFGVTANKVWRVGIGGTLPSWGPINLADGTNAITGVLASKANLPAVGQQISSSSGTYTTSSTTYVDVTNMSVNLTTIGRPVMVVIMDNSSSGTAGSCTTPSTGFLYWKILRDATVLTEKVVGTLSVTGSGNHNCDTTYIDVPSAGTYTYKMQAKVSTGTGGFDNYKIAVFEP